MRSICAMVLSLGMGYEGELGTLVPDYVLAKLFVFIFSIGIFVSGYLIFVYMVWFGIHFRKVIVGVVGAMIGAIFIACACWMIHYALLVPRNL